MKLLLIGLFVLPLFAFAHGDHHHHDGEIPKNRSPETPKQEAVFREINTAYVQRVKPIFQEKCFNCHSDHTVWPWYHEVPLVRWYLESDVAEGRHHLDFSKDFPFVSHATPIEDMDAIKKEIQEGDMPPWLYRLGHQGSAITDEEKRLIFDWTGWAKTKLQSLK